MTSAATSFLQYANLEVKLLVKCNNLLDGRA